MRKFSSSLASRVGKLAITLFAIALLCVVPEVSAISFASIPSPNLDLSSLGRVALAGDFDSISLFQFVGQNENTASSGVGSLLTRFPNGLFTALNQTDGEIRTMCSFVANGTLQGVVFGGNFTSVGGVPAQGIALFNPNTTEITPLPGLNGSVNSLYCDQTAGRVIIGGSFTGGGASNAIVWITGWTNMPFSGFNGPVTSIVKASNGNIIFGGQFDGLGNTTTPKEKDVQVIPVSSANVTSGSTTTTTGFSDPRNIICKTGFQDGVGNSWLLADNTPGFWQASFGFGFQPSKLRLYNTQQDGRGTKTWRFTALPINGIMNLSYVNPAGETEYCDSQCPLQNNNTYQDFHFVNTVGMNSFRIDISAWYGNGGGLSGIELFENDIYSFAINDFNEPTCGGVSTGANSTRTGTAWTVTPSGQSNSEYLTAVLSGSNIEPEAATVVFQPDIKQSGNYSVTVFTPGCISDGTCATRGRVNITGSMASSTKAFNQPLSTQLFQTNYFDKYDQVYFGYVDANNNNFRPTVTLSPAAGQSGPLTVVAQRVRFELLTPTTGGLNGLFEYNMSQQVLDSDFSNSAIDVAGASLSPSLAPITSLAVDGDTTYVAGNFSGDNFSNIFSISGGNATSLPGNGLNSEVLTMYHNDSLIYIGGNFTNTQDNKSTGLMGVAAYSITNKSWQPLGAGVNGVVKYIVPFTLNLTANQPEYVIAISGFFDTVLGFGNNATFSANNFAVWVPSRQNWLDNLNIATISIQGTLMAETDVPGFSPLFSGSVSSQALGASGAVEILSNKALSLEQFPINIRQQQSSASLRRRAANGQQNVTGAVTGLMYEENDLNITIIAGHFAATGSDGSNITNLLFVNGSNSDHVTGMGDIIASNSVFLSLGTYKTTLFAGGSISGTVNGNAINGLVLYDLSTATPSSTQPPGLQGTNVAVSAIAPQPSSTNVYVGGNFESAGALSCPSVCIWNTDRSQWISPGSGLSGQVSSMTWTSNTELVIAGNLTVGDNSTTMVTFNSQKNVFTEFTEAGTIPGPVTALCPANNDNSQFWVGGTARNGSAFLEKFDGKQWLPASAGLGQGTTIRSLQILSVSQSHGESNLIDDNEVLLLLGQINITNFGNASAVLFNGTTFTPFLLSSTADNAPGSLSQAFVQFPKNVFKSGGKLNFYFSPTHTFWRMGWIWEGIGMKVGSKRYRN
ncbi:hypothetical protein K432DRAFT_102210 [Lepidopterella palustris CBS 459.81]|uniref:Uncharacterized protein n=1 Tax=Lepidopterella palustris CBS 459.81 TaxID=1314670 RepID=A0A8E2EJ28_9PEZI|nr:hypothetical protein K432DRAFT_102210 [Lepidopterella palustris CBS 459.81]